MEIIIELMIQLVGEVLLELGFHSVNSALIRGRNPNPFLAVVGYSILGLILGVISIFVFPRSFITIKTLKIANLIITPTIVGLTMSIFGKIRKKKGIDLIRLDSFIFGFILAFSMALIRFIWTS